MTEKRISYWDWNGKYQDEVQQLRNILVPAMGQAETHYGELIRSITNVTYDHYNNGGCNWDVKQEEWEYLRDFEGSEYGKLAYDLMKDEMDEEECPDCDFGMVECYECMGSGYTSCDCCGEDDKDECEHCNDGTMECEYCGGGETECEDCNGQGTLQSFYFEGNTDKLEEYLYNLMNDIYEFIRDGK